ncbi:MAG TPA: hypothetical protein VIG84_00580 [Brevundimonas sp.]
MVAWAYEPTIEEVQRHSPATSRITLQTVSPFVAGTSPGAHGGRVRNLDHVSSDQLSPAAPSSA